MRIKSTPLLALPFLMLLALAQSSASANATAFTYQGQLTSGGTLANGSHDLTFSLHSAANGPAQIGNTLTNLSVPISNGLFTITLDFGDSAFDGTARWLEIGVRPVGGGLFTLLNPRQAINAAPFASYALTSGTILASGSVPDTALSPNVARRDVGNTFLGDQIFTNSSVRIQVGNNTVLITSNSISITGSQNINFDTSGDITFKGQNVRVKANATFAVNAMDTAMTNTLTATIRANTSLNLKGYSTSIQADNNLSVNGSAGVSVQSGGVVAVNGGLITLN